MEDTSKKTYTKVIIATVIGHIFWGFSFMASRVALDEAHMFLLLSHRFILAFVVMSALILIKVASVNYKGKNLVPLFWMGLMEPVVYFFGEHYGILHSNTIFSGVMIAMIPIVSTLAAILILKEVPTVLQMLFSVVSVGGVIGIGLISKNSGALELGGVIGLIIAVLAAVIYTLMGRKYSTYYTPFERTYAVVVMGTVVFTICALVYCKGDMGMYLEPLKDSGYTISTLFLGICCSVGSYFLAAYAITYLTVARATVFANLTTAVSVFAGAFFLHEPFSLLGVVFCIMILVGIYGVQIEAKEE